MSADISELKRRMEGALQQLSKEFSGLRTGRASASLLEHVHVDAYGGNVPLNQVGNVTVPEPRMLAVKVYDKSLVNAVVKAITAANLGVNPAADGDVIRVPIPDLSQERRQELIKVARKYAEETRVAIRNVRRDGNDALKKSEKDGKISKDELGKRTEEIQKLTDQLVKKVDEALASKEKEIMG
ncbi:MAG: ribosome recycling factor [Alphaproteobacteria bacterium]|nr:ribosome recycling factor [Alphaproteobacteria bacterium]